MKENKSIEKIFKMFQGWEELFPDDKRAIFKQELSMFSEKDLLDFIAIFQKAGDEYGFLPLSNLSAKFMKAILKSTLDVKFHGSEHIEEALIKLKSGETDRIVFISNHVSYSDANIIDAILHHLFEKHGFVNEFSVVVGPKVFEEDYRRFPAISFNTILIAQSLSRATKEAARSPREIAKAALKAVKDIKSRVKTVLIFPEGSRSRSGNLMQFLPGVLRLIDTAEHITVVPIGLTGGDKVVPMDTKKIQAAETVLTAGKSFSIAEIKMEFTDSNHFKQDVMDLLGKKVAECLPEKLSGYYKNFDLS